MTPSGQISTVFSFSGVEGYDPYLLVPGSDGNLYGINIYGGDSIGGSFDPSVDGDYPNAGLVLANDGNLYGVNLDGKYGDGTAFEITPEGVFTLLYTFDVTGNAPYVPPFQGTDGLLYGTIDPDTGPGNGAVFQLSNNLGPLVETVPTGGEVGKRVLILGNGLTGTTSVFFNGVPAEFKVEKDTFIRATVPAGATTGTVSVVTPSGTLNSNPQFVVTQ